MSNPYRSTASDSDPGSSSRRSVTPYLFAVAGVLVVAANYASATSVGLPGPTTFTHVVFCMLPISAALVAMRLTPNRQVVGRSSRTLGVVCFALLSISLALAILPYLSLSDPILAFVAENYFFGEYGRLPWTWLVLCGILPLVLICPFADHRTWVRVCASLGILIGHTHNAWVTWGVCHM